MAYGYVMTMRVKSRVENLLGTKLRCRYCLHTIEKDQDVIVYRRMGLGHSSYFHAECDGKRRL